MSVRLCDPERKSVLGIQIVSQVPLSGESADIPPAMQDLRESREFFQRVTRIRPDLQTSLRQVAMHPVLARGEAGQIGRPRRRTDRVVGKGLGKANTLHCQAVNVGSLEIRIAVAAQLPGALVVGEDENDVGVRVVRGVTGSRDRKDRCPQDAGQDEMEEAPNHPGIIARRLPEGQ